MSGAQNSITIIGGPQRSIQVNSSNMPSPVNLSTIDLHLAGTKQYRRRFCVFGGQRLVRRHQLRFNRAIGFILPP